MTAARLRCLALRSRRRGMLEMDLILGAYAGARLAAMTPGELDLYEALLAENDRDLYLWATRAAEPPERFRALIADIAGFPHRLR